MAAVYVPTPSKPPKPKAVVKPRHVPSVAENVALGERLARLRGYSDTDWVCLYNLGMRESGWNHLADNPTSTAFGIPQSLPGTKMLTHGDMYSPEVQIRWFLDYVKSRYGTPCAAYKFQVANNWY